MQRSWRTLLPLVILAALVGYIYTQQHAQQHPKVSTPPPVTAGAPAAAAPGPSVRAGAGLPAFLPPEARHTLALIAAGGPFPYRQDGAVFGNYEHLLPPEPRGYYHEYTVETPGARNRGARRIITGGDPPVAYWYTDDHYRSFREFKVPP